MGSFSKDNMKERMKFVELWAKYVREHTDREWSRQQNVIINSCVRSASISRENYLKLKGEFFRPAANP